MCPSLLSFPPFHSALDLSRASNRYPKNKHFALNKHRSHQKCRRSYNSPFSRSLCSSSRPKEFTSSIFICRISGNPSSSSTFISHSSTVGCSDSGCTRQESFHQPTWTYMVGEPLKRQETHHSSWCLIHPEYLDPTQHLHVNYLCTYLRPYPLPKSVTSSQTFTTHKRAPFDTPQEYIAHVAGS